MHVSLVTIATYVTDTKKGQVLEAEANAAVNGQKAKKYIYNLAENDLFTSSATVQFDQNSQQYHLYKANAGLERDELNLRVVGIVTDLALPPVARINYRTAKYVKQAVTLTGFGGESFENALEGIVNIQAKISQEMGQDVLLPWSPGKYKNVSTITASCRYFTPKRGSTTADAVPIDKTIDPDGVLAAVDDNKFKYTKDNVVGYFKRSTEESEKLSKNRYEATNPKTFAEGDIVEARLAFKAATTPESHKNSGQRQFKFIIVLRSMALIEDRFSREARLTSFRVHVIPQRPNGLHKRTADFSEDEDDDNNIENAGRRLRTMQLL